MSKKKTLLTILAVMLVCCIAVAGTLAVLFAKTHQFYNLMLKMYHQTNRILALYILL